VIAMSTGRKTRAQQRGVIASYDGVQFDAAVEARHGPEVMAAVRSVREQGDLLDAAALAAADRTPKLAHLPRAGDEQISRCGRSLAGVLAPPDAERCVVCESLAG
jgi:hypothetical protein